MRPDWDKITEEAFNSEETHDFSKDYCRRRAELQGGTTMEKRRITQKTHRFSSRIAATAAALIVIPTATVGVLHFAPSGNKNDDTKHGAAIEDTSIATEGQEVTAVTDLSEEQTTVDAPEEETSLAPEGAEVEPTLDADDPSYMKGNYQMVFYQVPGPFVGIDRGIFSYEPTDDAEETITPSWFYNVNGSYKDFYKKCESEMTYNSTGTVTGKYGTIEWDMFRDNENELERFLLKFENTNFVGVLDVTEGIDNEDLIVFIDNIDIMTKAELDACEDPFILVGGSSTNDLGDPEAAMLGSDVFHFSAEVEMEYDLKVNYTPAGYNLDNKEDSSWIYSDPSSNHAIDFKLYKYGTEAYKEKLIHYCTSNEVNDFLDKTDRSNSEGGKDGYICFRKEGPYKTETLEEWEERKANGWDNRDILIFNGETGYAVNFTVNDRMSDEELQKVIDGIEFVKRDTPRTETNYLPWIVSGETK